VSSWETLQVGRYVHGAIAAVVPTGLYVDFQQHQGFVRARDAGVDDPAQLAASFTVLDEVSAWIVELDGERDRIGLTLVGPPARAAIDGAAVRRATLEPEPPKSLPGVRHGEGVPFWELYMRRRSTRSWSNRQI